MRDAEDAERIAMAVYVDALTPARWRYRYACHMGADSREELVRFAGALGMQNEWLSSSTGRHREHFDLTPAMRRLAVAAGAVELSRREFSAKMRISR